MLPRDDVHGLLVALLGSQRPIVVNMFGYDDDELNKIIQSKLADQRVYIQMSLDRSQPGGVRENRSLLGGATMPSATASQSVPVRYTMRSRT